MIRVRELERRLTWKKGEAENSCCAQQWRGCRRQQGRLRRLKCPVRRHRCSSCSHEGMRINDLSLWKTQQQQGQQQYDEKSAMKIYHLLQTIHKCAALLSTATIKTRRRTFSWTIDSLVPPAVTNIHKHSRTNKTATIKNVIRKIYSLQRKTCDEWKSIFVITRKISINYKSFFSREFRLVLRFILSSSRRIVSSLRNVTLARAKLKTKKRTTNRIFIIYFIFQWFFCIEQKKKKKKKKRQNYDQSNWNWFQWCLSRATAISFNLSEQTNRRKKKSK